MDPSQQKMMMIMPFVMLIMFWRFAAGLVLYWLTSNVVSIVQQLLLNRFLPTPAVVQLAPAPKKKR
jgi:YidC/Oxa1 family membrane protein insertase